MLPDAYFAGFFDADGSVHIGRKAATGAEREHFRLECHVAQVDVNVLMRFHERFGGSVRREGRTTSTQNPVYLWSVAARDAERMLTAVLPWLVLKRDRAELGLEFRTWFAGVNVLPRRWRERPHVAEKCDRIQAGRSACHARMRLLNARGRNVTPV